MWPVLALILGGWMWTSCSNDFELTSEWKEIPVVYAILSGDDAVHYVRVEKAFLDPEQSALLIAQNPDSIYYPANAIQVYLQKVGNSTLFQLTRVDGNLEGFKRDTGIFADTPNWLYKITAQEMGGFLEENATYRLIIKRTDGQPDITAETVIPRKPNLISPNNTGTPPKIQFMGQLTTLFRWTHDNNSAFFNVHLTVPYREVTPTGTIYDTIHWSPIQSLNAESTTATSTLSRVAGNDFYTVVKNHIQTPNDGRTRYFGFISIEVEGGGKEIREYRETALANAGLTGAEILQSYSNMSEGFGLFTAKNYVRYNGYKLWEESIDSMRLSPITRDLNFKFQ